jgi:hypothetical protein
MVEVVNLWHRPKIPYWLIRQTRTAKLTQPSTQQEEMAQTQTNQQSAAAKAIQNQSWWDSTNAFSWFGELKIDDEEDDARNLKALSLGN